MNAPLQSIRSAPAADVGDSQQKCSNLMEWGGQAKSVPARGAGVVRECSITERYIHTWRYEERRDHARLVGTDEGKDTLIIIRDSLVIYEARCPGVVSHGARAAV